MATTSEGCGKLTGYHYFRLGQSISCTNMEVIALGFMDVDMDKLKNLKEARKEDKEGFVRDVIETWACRHPDDQVQKLARLLYKAAADGGYVDPHKVEEILGVSPSSLNSTQEHIKSPMTLDELKTIANNLRPYTADTMKIEVASWIEDYEVDMNDLYTDLTLEKIHNRVAYQDEEKLSHYTDLFHTCEPNQNVEHESLTFKTSRKKGHISRSNQTKGQKTFLKSHISRSKQTKSQKILMKADPGMGKTTQCKKISWDWAMRLFTYFHIVFLVFLKLVKPGDSIENAIIEQNPYMKGLKITEHKLRSILELVDGKCLLILDGLDEHAFGSNTDVLKIIRGEKYLNCNIIVTSRPHTTRKIKRYFPTVVRVEGFTRLKAKEFASKIFIDKRKIDDVLSFRPASFRIDVPVYKCPIILSFICLLVREDEIDLSDKTIHIGEIYTRMIRCLYRKFTIRKGIEFKISEFTKVLKSVGKLALQTLLSGNPLLRRSEVIKEVGCNAFDYGLLIGHEDGHRLIRDETADIWVTFPHRTIQEFLGAFYFVMMLDEGHYVDAILGKDKRDWIFVNNPLFLQFCLWLLRRSEGYFSIQRSLNAYNHLRDGCVETRGPPSPAGKNGSYVALVKLASKTNDELILTFLNDVNSTRAVWHTNFPMWFPWNFLFGEY